MLFNSHLFVFGFLPITVVGYFFILRRSSNSSHYEGRRRLVLFWLTFCSVFFYGYWKPEFLLLLGVSVFINAQLGKKLIEWVQLQKPARRTLVLGLFFNLFVLGYFKYAGFLVFNLNALMGTSLPLPQVLLPLAISFITFQKIAFLVDCYQGRIRNFEWLSFLFFVTFFPPLIAGPITHYREIEPQVRSNRFLLIDWDGVVRGGALFGVGLFKKWILADSFVALLQQGMSEAVWRTDLSFLEAWRLALSYTLQIYFDFSGYSSMAIGLALIFGIRLPLNFRSPYRASSLIEFWKRWHITLSEFLRDYLYIPLGGNRLGRFRRYSNLMMTMLLGGLWHGAGWNFIIWGFLHGVGLSINHAWREVFKTSLKDKSHRPLFAGVLGWVATFIFVVFTWVPFRAPGLAATLHLWSAMVGGNGGGTELIYRPDYISSFTYVLQQANFSFVWHHLSEVYASVEFVWIAVLLMIAVFGVTAETWAQGFRPRFAWGLGFGLVVFYFIQNYFIGNPSEFIYFNF